MRNQIAKLKTIRRLRADQRRREYHVARDELSAISGELDALREEAGAARRAMLEARAPSPVGVTVTLAEIERRAQLAQKYMEYLELLDQRIREADTRFEAQRNRVAEALMTLRAADRATEQLTTIDDKLAEDEARITELQEELQAEIIAKPLWSR